jgi:predicted metal-dependent phosphoesterase TrpH
VKRVDCHVHTSFSGDARISFEEIGQALDEDLVDVICVTDHNSVRAGLALADIHPGRVIVGSEVKTWAGEIIGLFLTDHVPRKSQPADVCESIKSQGGLVYVPHPFCPLHSGVGGEVLDDLVQRGLVDIIEAFNAKASLDAANAEAAAYAEAWGLAKGAGSDAHYPEFLGFAYVEMPDFDGPDAFLAAMPEGQIKGRRYTYADARWRTKIVP